jgi:hypothetical protein
MAYDQTFQESACFFLGGWLFSDNSLMHHHLKANYNSVCNHTNDNILVNTLMNICSTTQATLETSLTAYEQSDLCYVSLTKLRFTQGKTIIEF